MPRPKQRCYKLETFLSENAFISMITAAVETYPEETLGVLIGAKGLNTIHVQYAVAYQTAKRSKKEVEPHWRRSLRTNEFLSKVARLEIVGDFHSHTLASVDTKASVKLSQPDKDSMSVGNIGIVIAINKDRNRREWRHLRKGSLKGSIHPYTLKITSWFEAHIDEFRISKVHCPFALGLGR